jgi:hypothetical protein
VGLRQIGQPHHCHVVAGNAFRSRQCRDYCPAHGDRGRRGVLSRRAQDRWRGSAGAVRGGRLQLVVERHDLLNSHHVLWFTGNSCRQHPGEGVRDGGQLPIAGWARSGAGRGAMGYSGGA